MEHDRGWCVNMFAQDVRFASVISQHGRYRPGLPAITDAFGMADYSELSGCVESVAAGLRERVGVGGRIGIAMAPSAPYLVLLDACMLGGVVGCPLNTRLAAPEAARYLAPLDAGLIVVDSEHADWASQLGGEVLVLESVRFEAPLRTRLAELASAQPEELSASAPGDAALLFGTGGTTGVPKAAIYNQAAVVANMWCLALDGKRTSVTHELSCAPYFHLGVMGPLATLFFGGHVEILDRYDPQKILAGIGSGVTTVGAPAPSMWQTLRRHPEFQDTDRERLQFISYGTAPSTPEFAQNMLADYPRAEISSGFGATETGFVAYATRRDLEAGRVTGVGRPIAGVTVRVLGEDGRDVPPGEVGELAISTPWSASGYWNSPDETRVTWSPEGIRLGDIGTVDEDGWLSVRGRKKEMIISGGENIFPAEVEPVLLRHPMVREAVVYGVPDAEWGERVEVAVVLEGDGPLDLQEVRAWARPHIAAYKLPRRLRVINEIPRTAVLKPDRVRLRAAATAADDSAPAKG